MSTFFEAALRDHLGLTDIQVMAVGGKTRLTRSLEILVNDIDFPNGSIYAVVRVAPGKDTEKPPGLISAKKARERGIVGSLKPFRWNPAGNQSRPVEPDQQPEASLAWWVGDHPYEA